MSYINIQADERKDQEFFFFFAGGCGAEYDFTKKKVTTGFSFRDPVLVSAWFVCVTGLESEGMVQMMAHWNKPSDAEESLHHTLKKNVPVAGRGGPCL